MTQIIALIPFTLSEAAFAASGFFVGFITAAWLFSKSEALNSFHKRFLSLVIVSLWISFLISDLISGTVNTSIWLNLFFGSVVGTVNHDAGKWLSEVVSNLAKIIPKR